MEDTVEKVLQKILQKLNGFVDTVEPEKLSPQSMKHVTATLKDIQDLTDKYIKKIDELCAAKEKELMAI